ncbi:helix-turn-helix transcriptional regulator [Lampropedia puyangensis]|uniref:Helix-turn-helix transcriptional regulator n=1 Tax=Lampropedia puyangensis TaxID=1330072 RepID=A0A4S8FCE5_9BURK|nr:metalloregulator ArsR/SmtB family transcription factor [Lampropedia puyangensis]THU05293.1 helix-turn-helix transcriptional regulator [Lampropedia puyangensis]
MNVPSNNHFQFMRDNVAQAADMLRLLSNEHRLLVLCLLLEQGEMSVTALLEHLEIGQSALSQHLAKLRAARLVTYRRDAQVLYYRIQSNDVSQLIATLKQIYCP